MDGSSQILKWIGFIENPPPCRGHDPIEIEGVQPPQQRIGRQGELENAQRAFGFEEAFDFRKRRGSVGDVTDAEGAGDNVEAMLRQVRIDGVGKAPADGFVLHPLSGAAEHLFFLGVEDHRLAEVQAGNVADGAVPEKTEDQIAGAATKIQNAVAGFGFEQADETLAPCAVDAEAEQVIAAVVVLRHRVENKMGLFMCHFVKIYQCFYMISSDIISKSTF